MTALLAILSIVLIAVVAVQIGRVTELAAKIRGEKETQDNTNSRNANFMVIFCVLFLIGCVWSAWYYIPWMLGFGPHEAASTHGRAIDGLFNTTLIFTGIVFFATQIALFWFAYKYKQQDGRASLFIPHDNKLEIIWTGIPAVVMCILVVQGLVAWNDATADIKDGWVAGVDYTEIEATGMQFNWLLRYPGPDNQLGERDYLKIDAANPLGQVWDDTKNLDDFQPDEIVLPVGKPVRVRITSRDVLHNFYLPHFRVKMDAVPGMPTYFVFTPEKTTEEYREGLKEYPEYNVPADPEDPEGPKMWEAFDYFLACAELCGKSHFSMKRTVRVVEQEEYDAWLKEEKNKSYYMSQIRNTDSDPYKGKLLSIDIADRKASFESKLAAARAAEAVADRIIRLDYVFFETGSANLTDLSKYEISNVAQAMKDFGTMKIELGGHTDATGNADANMTLSDARANAVRNELIKLGVPADRLTAAGYGQEVPFATNDTEEGRAQNRRTEIKILEN